MRPREGHNRLKGENKAGRLPSDLASLPLASQAKPRRQSESQTHCIATAYDVVVCDSNRTAHRSGHRAIPIHKKNISQIKLCSTRKLRTSRKNVQLRTLCFLVFEGIFIDPQNPLMYLNHPMTKRILENWLLNDTYFKLRSIGLGIFHLLFHQGI